MASSPPPKPSSIPPLDLPPPPQLLLFGDSITQASSSLLTRLETHYLRRLDILNRGFSGYTTRTSLAVLPSFFPSSTSPSSTNPRILGLTIFLGANDSCLPGAAQHVPLSEYIANLRRIITWVGIKQHGTVVVLITPPPIDEWQLPEFLQTRTAENTKRYAEAARQVAVEEGAAVLDLWRIFMAKAGWTNPNPSPETSPPLPGSKAAPQNAILAQLLSDGLHFTEEGYDVWFEELMKLIAEDDRLTELRVDDSGEGKGGKGLGMWYPDWKDLVGL